jgi:hypothetical protein
VADDGKSFTPHASIEYEFNNRLLDRVANNLDWIAVRAVMPMAPARPLPLRPVVAKPAAIDMRKPVVVTDKRCTDVRAAR